MPITGQNFAIVILAAGASTRLGQPKQLVEVDGSPLVVRMVEVSLMSGANPVVVVLGAHANSVRNHLKSLPVIVVENAVWAEGIGSSIRAGIEAVERLNASTRGALIALVDQPHFSVQTIERLSHAFSGPDCIVAAHYAGTTGVPALFGRNYFSELCMLKGDTGARKVIASAQSKVVTVPMPEMAIDLDTPEELRRFRGNEKA